MRSKNVLDIKKTAAARGKDRIPRASLSNRPARLRTRRRNRRIVLSVAGLLLAAGSVGALGAASHLERFAITDVQVIGASQLTPESVAHVAKARLHDSSFRLFSRNNILLYPKSAIESDVRTEFSRIKNVSVARESLLASAMVIHVEEREAFATWCSSETNQQAEDKNSITSCYAMDKTGLLYAEAGEGAERMYRFEGGLVSGEDPIRQTFLRGRFAGVVGLLDSLTSAGFTPVQFAVDTESDFTVSLARGPQLRASFDMAPADIVRNLTTTLEAEGLRDQFESLEYIDLRFGNRVYYK